jgi:hypothetical protein
MDDPTVTLKLSVACPQTLWDEASRVFTGDTTNMVEILGTRDYPNLGACAVEVIAHSTRSFDIKDEIAAPLPVRRVA